MSGLGVDIDDGDLGRRLAGFAAALLDLRPFWPRAASWGRGIFSKQFATEGAYGGDPWAPLSAATVAARGAAHPILVDTGAMKGAASYARRVGTPTTLELIIDDPKIGFHQSGTRKMPRRPVVPDHIPEPAIEELESMLNRYFDEVEARWGLR